MSEGWKLHIANGIGAALTGLVLIGLISLFLEVLKWVKQVAGTDAALLVIFVVSLFGLGVISSFLFREPDGDTR